MHVLFPAISDLELSSSELGEDTFVEADSPGDMCMLIELLDSADEDRWFRFGGKTRLADGLCA